MPWNYEALLFPFYRWKTEAESQMYSLTLHTLEKPNAKNFARQFTNITDKIYKWLTKKKIKLVICE